MKCNRKSSDRTLEWETAVEFGNRVTMKEVSQIKMKTGDWKDLVRKYIPWAELTQRQIYSVKSAMKRANPGVLVRDCSLVDASLEELRYYHAFEGIRLEKIERCLDAAAATDLDDIKALEKLYQRFRKARISEDGYATETEIKIRNAIDDLSEAEMKKEIERRKTLCRQLWRQNRIREIRLTLGLDQKTMAKVLGIGRSYYNQIERNKIRSSNGFSGKLLRFINSLSYKKLQDLRTEHEITDRYKDTSLAHGVQN